MSIRLATYYRAEDIPSLPGANVFHSTALFRALQQTPGYRPVLLVAYQDSCPVGRLLCVTRRYFRIFGFVEKTYVYGTGEYFSPSVPADDVFREMLSYLTATYRERSFVIEFRNLEEPLFGYRHFRANGYFPVRWLRLRNSIHHGRLDKWMSASRRRQIQQGLKNGAVMDVARSREDVYAFFRMLKKYYSSKISHYLPDVEFFISLFSQSSVQEMGKIFLVRYKDRIVGGSVCLFSGKDAFLLFSGGMRKSYPLQYPGVLAVWGAMVYARDRGYSHFEFIDAGLPFKRYGFRDFILRFGGRQMSSRRWYHVKWKWLNRLMAWFYV